MKNMENYNLQKFHEETIKLVGYLENKGESELAKELLKTFIKVFELVKTLEKYNDVHTKRTSIHS